MSWRHFFAFSGSCDQLSPDGTCSKTQARVSFVKSCSVRHFHTALDWTSSGLLITDRSRLGEHCSDKRRAERNPAADILHSVTLIVKRQAKVSGKQKNTKKERNGFFLFVIFCDVSGRRGLDHSTRRKHANRKCT